MWVIGILVFFVVMMYASAEAMWRGIDPDLKRGFWGVRLLFDLLDFLLTFWWL